MSSAAYRLKLGSRRGSSEVSRDESSDESLTPRQKFWSSPDRPDKRVKKATGFPHGSRPDPCRNPAAFGRLCRVRLGELQNRPSDHRAEVTTLLSAGGQLEMESPYLRRSRWSLDVIGAVVRFASARIHNTNYNERGIDRVRSL